MKQVGIYWLLFLMLGSFLYKCGPGLPGNRQDSLTGLTRQGYDRDQASVTFPSLYRAMRSSQLHCHPCMRQKED